MSLAIRTASSLSRLGQHHDDRAEDLLDDRPCPRRQVGEHRGGQVAAAGGPGRDLAAGDQGRAAGDRVVFIDAIHVKIRDGQVANRPIYVAIAVTADGYREILGLWAGDGGEGAKFWQQVLTDLRNRGVRDVLVLVCDGLSARRTRSRTCGHRLSCSAASFT